MKVGRSGKKELKNTKLPLDCNFTQVIIKQLKNDINECKFCCLSYNEVLILNKITYIIYLIYSCLETANEKINGSDNEFRMRNESEILILICFLLFNFPKNISSVIDWEGLIIGKQTFRKQTVAWIV